MAAWFRLGFWLVPCPVADIADKAAALDVVETEAVVVDIHLFHHRHMICDGDLTGKYLSIRFVNGILGIVHLSDFNDILISDEYKEVLLNP